MEAATVAKRDDPRDFGGCAMSWPWLIVSAGTIIGLALLIYDLLQAWPMQSDPDRDVGLAALGRAVERANVYRIKEGS